MTLHPRASVRPYWAELCPKLGLVDVSRPMSRWHKWLTWPGGHYDWDVQARGFGNGRRVEVLVRQRVSADGTMFDPTVSCSMDLPPGLGLVIDNAGRLDFPLWGRPWISSGVPDFDRLAINVRAHSLERVRGMLTRDLLLAIDHHTQLGMRVELRDHFVSVCGGGNLLDLVELSYALDSVCALANVAEASAAGIT